MIDAKLRKLLFSIYWDNGWRDAPIWPDPEGLQLLVANRLSFPNEIIGHDEVMSRLQAILDKADPRGIGTAFLASLSSRRPELRSALYSYGVLKPIASHRYQGWSQGHRVCEICNTPENCEYDFTELTFMRYKFGMGAPDLVMPNVFILEQFEDEDVPEPRSEDLEIMKTLVRMASNLSEKNGPDQLKKSIKSAFKSSDQERYVLVEALGYAGVLKPADDSEEAYARVHPRSDWMSPVCLWHGPDGVNADAVEKFFPDYAEELLAATHHIE